MDPDGYIKVSKKKIKLAKKSKLRRLKKRGKAKMELTYIAPTWTIESVADSREFHIKGMTDRVRHQLKNFSRISKQRCTVKGQFDDKNVYITALEKCKGLSIADNTLSF